MAGSKVPSDPNMSSEVRRFLDDRARNETSIEASIAALEAAIVVFATEAQAQAGTSEVVYMNPARTVDAIFTFSPFLKFAHYQDQQSSGTDGGDFTIGAWRTRTINTEVYDNIGISLSSNQMTLPAGTYFIDATTPGYRVTMHQARLYNNTATAAILSGTTEHAPLNTGGDDPSGQTSSRIRGRFVLAAQSALSIEHQCADTQNTDGFGRAAGFGTEIYTDIMIWKLSE
jgi:hypothetical protein